VVSTVFWVAILFASCVVCVFGTAFAMGISAGATRYRLIRERDEARRALQSWQSGADAAYQDGAE
jgi:hypothetical protein